MLLSHLESDCATDFGFEVDDDGKITFDTTIITNENEWKDDVDEWMHFIWHEFDFFDQKHGRKHKGEIPKALLIKSSKQKSCFKTNHQRRQGLEQQEENTEHVYSDKCITIKGLSRKDIKRSYATDQPVLVMNPLKNLNRIMTTGLRKQKKSPLLSFAVTISNSTTSSSEKNKSPGKFIFGD